MYNKVELCGMDTAQLPILTEAQKRELLTKAHAGITTVWVNPERRLPHPEIVPDYEIESLAQLEALLETM